MKCHTKSQWHSDAILSSIDFEKVMDKHILSIHKVVDSAYPKTAEGQKVKL